MNSTPHPRKAQARAAIMDNGRYLESLTTDQRDVLFDGIFGAAIGPHLSQKMKEGGGRIFWLWPALDTTNRRRLSSWVVSHDPSLYDFAEAELIAIYEEMDGQIIKIREIPATR